jgi:hypothetical protein
MTNIKYEDSIRLLNKIIPNDNLKNLIRFHIINIIKGLPILEITLHPQKRIMRTVSNYLDGNISFFDINQLNHKPSKFNNNYQRASTPNMTMFYGSYLPEEQFKGIVYDHQLTGSTEAIKMIRQNTNGEEKVTYTQWIVTKDIRLCGIFFSKKYRNTNDYLNLLSQNFLKNIRSNNLKYRTEMIYDFVCHHFSKDVREGNEFEYMISSIFTEEIIKHGLHGVAYPSVKMDGSGINVAIHPEISMSSLELVHVVECTVYKNGKNIVVDNDKMSNILKGQSTFELKPVNPDNHSGKDELMRLYPQCF